MAPAPETLCNICGKPKLIGDPERRLILPYSGTMTWACENCRVNLVCDAWKHAGDWQQLVGLNHSFLRGELWCTPGHQGPVDDETLPMLSGLMRLHEYGIITETSQPFEHSIKTTKHRQHGRWIESKQRPTLNFMIPTSDPKISKDQVSKLVSGLLNNKIIVASVHSMCHKYSVPKEASEHKATVLPPQQHHRDDKIYDFRTSGPTGRGTSWTTISRMADSIESLPQADWEHCTHLAFDTIANVTDLGIGSRMFPAQIKAMPLMVEIAAKEWGVPIDLQDIVEQECEKAGMKRVYTVQYNILRAQKLHQ